MANPHRAGWERQGAQWHPEELQGKRSQVGGKQLPPLLQIQHPLPSAGTQPEAHGLATGDSRDLSAVRSDSRVKKQR